MSLLGLDVGMTGTKGVAFDLDGRILASAYREYPLISPRPGWQELDPNRIWLCVKAVLAEVARAVRNNPIQSLAVSCMGEACVPISQDGACLANSLAPFDARTADMPAWWLERLSRRDIVRISGVPLHGMYTINKIMWFKKNRADVYAKTKKFLYIEDYIHFRLGLDPVMSFPLAARTMAFDIHAGDWSDQLLGLAGVDRSLFPRTAPSGKSSESSRTGWPPRSDCRGASSSPQADTTSRQGLSGRESSRAARPCMPPAPSSVSAPFSMRFS